MVVTTFRAMVNTEPHQFRAKFNKPYEELKASDILEKAAKFLKDYFTHHRTDEAVPEDVRSQLLLRYLTEEDAFAISSAHQPGSPISELFPNPYTRLATEWYRTTGYNLSSVAVKDDALLASVAPSQDTTRVRWYILLSASFHPHRFFVPMGVKDDTALARAREDYLQLVEINLANRGETGLAPPAKVSANPLLFSGPPVSVGLCPTSDYGPDPILVDPIFAEAYSLLLNPDLVELETSSPTHTHGFDIYYVASQFRTICNTIFMDESDFNTAVVSVLQELLDFIPVELHFKVYDGDNTLVAEIDWLSLCHTVHGLTFVPFTGEGKKGRNTGGDSVLQTFLSMQRFFAVSEQLKHYLKLTGSPFVVLTVEGSVLNVWFGYFRDKLYGALFFTFDLARSACGSSKTRIHDLAVKLQIVRNTVRKLHRHYVNLHACTRHPSLPYLLPQPLSLLQCLIPAPAPEVVDSLASLKLNIVEYVAFPNYPSRCLYKGVITESGEKRHVYVKFVANYGEAAHRLLAQQDPPLAPKLYWCGEVINGKTMVVMEELGHGRRNIHPRNSNSTDIDIVKRDIRQALDVLHANHLVHGDIREPNMVIARGRGHLIDFDSAGEEGVARYPESLNPKVTWVESVAAEYLTLRCIGKEHDDFRFERVLKELAEKDGHKRARDDEKGEGDRERKRSRSDDDSMA
ncbi:hypothetical protein LXA43DRAFT_425094 [Ganoderma leucocontextum]|nr:hypothetical protein LXA43DRAFT_425094 [Ganoderma leucocontextum]